MSAEKVIVALDKTSWPELEHLAKSLQGQPCWMKVGMELFYSHGPKAVDYIAGLGFKVFLDLKLHDIPNTVHHGLLNLLKLPVQMLNVHASGGPVMLQKAKEALEKSNRKDVTLIAVTQLTSTTEEMMQQSLGIQASLLETVLKYAEMTKEAGLHGVVCSPLEVSAIKKNLGEKFLCITPGIRPKTSDNHDQKRVTTPQEALLLGTDYLVIGRALTQAKDPRLALENLFKE